MQKDQIQITKNLKSLVKKAQQNKRKAFEVYLAASKVFSNKQVQYLQQHLILQLKTNNLTHFIANIRVTEKDYAFHLYFDMPPQKSFELQCEAQITTLITKLKSNGEQI